MADVIANIVKGAAIEKVRDSGSNLGVMLLKVNESEGTLIDRDDLGALLAAANTEADFTNYARKTGITGTITVDDTNDRVDLDMPDQTWSSAGGASDNTLTKAVPYYEESAADANRIPIAYLDFPITTNGGNVTMVLNAAGFFRAA